MKLKKILFVSSMVGILVLIFLAQTTIPMHTGTIESIMYSKNKITIQLNNSSVELILFETSFIDLKKGDIIKFQGKHGVYKNKEQIIVDKIYKND